MGWVGRPHGQSGAFHVSGPTERVELLDPGRRVHVGTESRVVLARGGTPERPVLTVEGIADRAAAAAATGLPLAVAREELPPPAEGEYLIADLIGCEVVGDTGPVGVVRNVVVLPSVEALEVERADADVLLVPLVGDAVAEVDVAARRIHVNVGFLEAESGAT